MTLALEHISSTTTAIGDHIGKAPHTPTSAPPRSGTSTASSTAGSALSCGLVSLLLVCPGGASHVRRLPRALSVANLRLLLERLCGVAADRQVLALRDAQGCVSELGTDDSRALSYYEVQVGETRGLGLSLSACQQNIPLPLSAGASRQS